MKTKHFSLTLFVFVSLGAGFSANAQQAETKVDRHSSDTLTALPAAADANGDSSVFTVPEIEASVNAAAWRRHLENQLVPVIQKAATSGIKPGTYTINVRFLVEKDGRLTDVKALNDVGYGLAAGAVRVVKTGPHWTPGEQNGRKVRSYHTQPITFVITEK